LSEKKSLQKKLASHLEHHFCYFVTLLHTMCATTTWERVLQRCHAGDDREFHSDCTVVTV